MPDEDEDDEADEEEPAPGKKQTKKRKGLASTSVGASGKTTSRKLWNQVVSTK